jgi:DNA-binding GntR family transcriptional regulator
MPIPVDRENHRRNLLRDDVHLRLRDAIVDGTLAPGEKLRDQELATWLGVSRTPVREALLRLAQTGLVHAAPGRSTTVATLDARAIRDAQAVVAAMHRLAVELAVGQLDAADLDEMREANERFTAAVRRGDADAAIAADDAFHGVPVRAAANGAVEAVLDQFTPVLRRVERLRFSSLAGRASVDLHARLVDLCEAGDAEAAASVSHQTWQTLKPLLDTLADAGADADADADAVRTVFAWSYRALPRPAARLFRLLGLHPGPDISLGAAAALAGTGVLAARQTLDSLVGAHLLDQTAPDRYEFHDLLRAYAGDLARRDEPAEERGQALRRVLGWYLHSADAARRWINPIGARLGLVPLGEAVEALSPGDYDQAVDFTEREHANLLAATRVAASVDGDAFDRLAWQLAVVHWDAWTRSGPIAAWLATADLGLLAVRRLGDERAGEAELLDRIGRANAQTHRHGESLTCHRQALVIRRELGDRLGEATTLNALGMALFRSRRLDEGAACFGQALRAFRELGDDRWQATTLSNLAGTHYRAGRLAEAGALVEEALAAHRALNSERGEGNALRILSDIQRERGEVEAALRTAERTVEIALRLRNRVLEGFWLLTLGEAQAAGGLLGEALESYQRSADLHRRVGDRAREALAWQGAGATYRRMGRAGEAAAFHRRAAAVHREQGDRWDEAVALAGLAAALREPEPEGARRHRGEALALLAAYDDPRAAALRETLHEALREAGDR